jgi:iron(III) transport system permease protein
VATFNHDTLTTAVYKAWFGLFSLPAASQLASLLVLIAFLALALEQRTRSRMRFSASGPGRRLRLCGTRSALALLSCTIVFVAGFALPLVQLVYWLIEGGLQQLEFRYLTYAAHSIALGLLSATSICILSVLLAYASRRHGGAAAQAALRIATLGYAVPGAVLAVGIFSSLAWLDAGLPAGIRELLGLPPGVLLQGSVAAMILAYMVRFLAVGFGPIDAAMHRVTRHMEEAAIVLGTSGWRMLARIHVPLLKSGIATGAILVIVDVMKEMPITLMTRPFGWDTLAVRIFELTSEGQWQQAALPAVLLVAVGLFPVMQLARSAD